MNKKTLIIIGTIVGLAVIGFTVFYFTRPAGTGEEQGGIFSFLFPSSATKPRPGAPGNGAALFPETGGAPIPGQAQAELIQLTRTPVAGATFNAEKNKVFYFEKSTGYLYQTDPRGENKEQLSINTIPKIFEVTWLKNGYGAVLRYLETGATEKIDPFRTFLAYPVASSTKELEGIFLPENTGSITVSPDEEKIFYLAGEDSSIGVTASYQNKNLSQIFSSSFSGFLAAWPEKNTITLITKPSSSLDGYLYKLDVKTKAFTKILGPINGLTALSSPAFDKILYSQSSGKSFITKIYGAENKELGDFNYNTFPEKCLFSKTNENLIFCAVPKVLPTGDYPDDWYKGKISFTDGLWQIDLENGSTKMLLEPEKQGNFDIINLFADEKEEYFFFQNKKDGTLWSLKIEN